MADVVVDEATLNSLVAAKELLERINASPKTRPLLTRAIKEHYPNTRTDEDVAEEVARPYIEKVEATASRLQQKLDALDAREARAAERETIDQMEASFARLRKSYGYNDEGIEKIKALMVDRNIPDPDAAAALFERQNPPAAETRSSWEPDSYDIRNNAVDVDVQGLFADPEKWADREVGRVLLDIRSQNAA
jgi:hypothetical protein